MFGFLLVFCVFGLGISDPERALERLTDRFTQLADTHSHLSALRSMIPNLSLRTTKIDFEGFVEKTKSQLSELFDRQRTALRRVIAAAEKATEGEDFDEQFVSSEEDCQRYLRQINATEMSENPKEIRSGIHVAVGAFKCDQTVLRDFHWTKKETIEKAFEINSHPYLLRQFVGTYSGLTRIFPAFHWEIEPPNLTVDLFDPRYRPWFVGAESGPKDIIFLIDLSGSVKGQTLHLIKTTIQQILFTLTPNDYFGAIWYNLRREFVMSMCSGDRMLSATSRNKRLLLEMLGRIEERDQAMLPPALNMTLSQFFSKKYFDSIHRNQTSGGQRMVMLFTDGIEFWPVEVIRKFRSEKIRVFGYSMGHGTGPIAALDWITCEMDGVHTIVDSIADVRSASRKHLGKLSQTIGQTIRQQKFDEREFHFSFPYMDTQNEGPVLTLSAPILNRMLGNVTENSLAGVAGIDIGIERIRSLIPQNEEIRAFLVDNNGIVFYHPLFKYPQREVYSVRRTACHSVLQRHRTGTRVQYGPVDDRIRRLIGLVDSISTFDIMEVEMDVGPKFSAFRDSIIDGNCGEGFSDGSREYRCAPIDGTPFVLGFIWSKDMSVLETDTSPQTITDSSEENPLIAQWVRNPSLCGEYLSADGELERLDGLLDSISKESECITLNDRSLFAAFWPIATEWRSFWPTGDENETSCLLTPRPEGFDEHFRSAFIEWTPGIVSFFPKCEFENLRHFFESRTIVSNIRKSVNDWELRIDPFTDIITSFRSIFDEATSRIVALSGIQWSPDFFTDILSDLLKWDEQWKFCSDDSFVLGSNDLSPPTHLSLREPALFDQLVGLGMIKRSSSMTYDAKCGIGRRAYPMNTTATSAAPRPLFGYRFLRRFFQILISSLYSLTELPFGDALSRPFIDDEDQCHFKSTPTTEECVIEKPMFRFVVSKLTTIKIKPQYGCSGSFTIVPGKSNLYLLVLETHCANNQSQKNRRNIPLTSKYDFRPTKIADCHLTKERKRRRLHKSISDFWNANEDKCSSNGLHKDFHYAVLIFLSVFLTITGLYF